MSDAPEKKVVFGVPRKERARRTLGAIFLAMLLGAVSVNDEPWPKLLAFCVVLVGYGLLAYRDGERESEERVKERCAAIVSDVVDQCETELRRIQQECHLAREKQIRAAASAAWLVTSNREAATLDEAMVAGVDAAHRTK